MILKLATLADEAEVFRMVKAHWDHGPYSKLSFSEIKVRDRIRYYIQNQGSDYIVILACEEKPVGMIAAFAYVPHFTEDRMATEEVWWVDPEYRNSRIGFELIKAYEFWAKNKADCSIKHLALFEMEGRERIANYYKRKGFVPTEQTFVKIEGL